MSTTPLSRGIVLFIIMLIFPVVVLGQNSDEACRASVNRAFSELSTNCTGLEPNEVCYGYGELIPTFNVDGEATISASDYGNLQEAGDRVSLLVEDDNATLESLSGIPFAAPDSANEDAEWGISLINVQANLPQQIDSNGVNYILFGDATIENAVLFEDAFFPGDAIEVSVDNASIFNKPPGYQFDNFASEVVDIVSDTFEADAISPDGEWVRVYFSYERTLGERTTAWLQTSDLIDEVDLSALPVLGSDSFGAMQDFYFESATSLSGCSYAVPNGMLIQGPSEVETDIRVNELPIRLTSTAFIDKIGVRSLRISVLAGFVQINPGFDNEIIVSAGEEVIVCLTQELESLGIDGIENDRRFDPECGIEGPFVFGTNGASVSDVILQRFQVLSNLPGNVINYNIPTITIIRASGVGRPQIMIVINPPQFARRIRELCDSGVIPGQICNLLQ